MTQITNNVTSFCLFHILGQQQILHCAAVLPLSQCSILKDSYCSELFDLLITNVSVCVQHI